VLGDGVVLDPSRVAAQIVSGSVIEVASTDLSRRDD
jgi:hypothetical protein